MFFPAGNNTRCPVRLFRRKIKNPVIGTAQVTSCGAPGNPRAIRSTCVLFVIVEGPGLVPTSYELRKQLQVARWPQPGMTLPCRVDAENPDRFEIDFDSIPDWQEQARANAAEVAAQRAMATKTPVGVGAGHGITVVGAATPEQTASAVRKAESVLGLDLDGDGRVG